MNYAIIAAGDGSRLVQEGISVPKPLIDLDGRPMIRRLIDIFTELDAETVSIIVNEYMTEVRAYLESVRRELPCNLNLVVKTTPSSMHSFMEVSRVFPKGSKFVLTTVDTVFRKDDFSKYVRAFETVPSDIDGMMGVTTYIDDEKPLYVDVDSKNVITAFCDTAFDGVKYISAGIYGLTTPAIDVLHKCIEEGVSRMRNYQRELVKTGLKLEAYDLGKVIDVDHIGDIERAREFIR